MAPEARVSGSTLALVPVPDTKQTPPSGVAVEQRANDLLNQMTPEEKIGQLSVIFALGSAQVL